MRERDGNDYFETATPPELEGYILSSPTRRARLLAYLDAIGVEHSGTANETNLALACGVAVRTWRRWTTENGKERREMPIMVRRLLYLIVHGVDL